MGFETVKGRPEPIDVEIDGIKVRLANQGDDVFNIYIENCSFNAKRIGDQVEIRNTTPHEFPGAWKADKLKTIALKALAEYTE